MKPNRKRGSVLELGPLKVLVEWIQYGNITWVSLAPVLLGLCMLGVAIPRMQMVGPPEHVDFVPRLLAAAALAIMGLSGLIQVWRREVPGPLGGGLRGPVAVFLGWIFALAFWAAAIASLFVF